MWTEWSRRTTDTCVYCDSVLIPPIEIKHNEFRSGNGMNGPSFRTVRKNDGVLMKGIRKIALVAHLVYAAIMAAFMMVVAVLVH